MPLIAILDNKRVRVEDIYKYNIPKNSSFICSFCNDTLIFKQNRNGENKKYTEHFSHVNNKKGTKIKCEYDITNKDNKFEMTEWHKLFSNANNKETTEIRRSNPINNKNHFVDVFDEKNNQGIEFQHSHISKESILSREETSKIDWIFDVTNKYTCIWNDIGVCEIPSNNWEDAVKHCKNNVFLCTGKKQMFHLKNRDSYRIEIDNKVRNVWICDIISLDDIINLTCLKNTLTIDGKIELKKKWFGEIEETDIIYARCKKSMTYLDPIMRKYVLNIEYEKNMVYGIKSVAGSGKTTILLDLARANSDKKILYLAFNRAIVEEIRKKKGSAAKNLNPYTFDALMRKLYISKKKREHPNIIDLRPVNFGDIPGFEWYKNKSFKMKQRFITIYNLFCKNIEYDNIFQFMKDEYPDSKAKKQLIKMWNHTIQDRIITFNSIRKMALINGWFKIIDTEYDMVFIDEAQDFDNVMLKMLLKQTTIPKVFVGDPRQAIYKWRGAINSFDELPYDSHIVEFYKTWRIGDPACEEIRRKFRECWMVAGTNNNTILHENVAAVHCKGCSYHYLFRSWRHLLMTASNMENIWINNFESKRQAIKKLHPKLLQYGKDSDMEFEDDLPGFLLKLTADELETLILNIENNLVDKKLATCCMYTIHSYKGLENDNIRIFNDIDIENEEELFYVALTRGKKNIYLDSLQ